MTINLLTIATSSLKTLLSGNCELVKSAIDYRNDGRHHFLANEKKSNPLRHQWHNACNQ
jgi:hypothetical protein